jgi:hypothetical protein
MDLLIKLKQKKDSSTSFFYKSKMAMPFKMNHVDVVEFINEFDLFYVSMHCPVVLCFKIEIFSINGLLKSLLCGYSLTLPTLLSIFRSLSEYSDLLLLSQIIKILKKFYFTFKKSCQQQIYQNHCSDLKKE